MDIADLPRPVGFVLGGGGSLEAVQVGMLQALGEHGVAPDLVAGTSIGSINGAVLALDPKGAANRLSHSWPKMKREQILPGGPLDQARTLRRTKTHLFPNNGLATVISDFLGEDTTFDDLEVPFAAVTMDVATARPHVIREGRLLPRSWRAWPFPGFGHWSSTKAASSTTGASSPMSHCVKPRTWGLVRWWCSTAPSPAGSQRRPRQSPKCCSSPGWWQCGLKQSSKRRWLPPQSLSCISQGLTHTPCRRSTSIAPPNSSRPPTLAARSFLEHLDITGPGLYGSPSSR